LYNTGDISWYRFIDEKSVIRITGGWKFKLLADLREEKLKFLLEDEY
jgi:peptidase E